MIPSSDTQRPKLIDQLERIFFVFAAIWSFGAGLYWLLSPVAIHEITAESTANGSSTVEETVRQASWYEVQGLWGVAVLLIFALLYLAVAIFAIRRQRVPLAIASLLAVVVTLLAGLSIGPLYLPAANAVLAGWITWGLNWLLYGQREVSG
jgi:hypothetical protein